MSGIEGCGKCDEVDRFGWSITLCGKVWRGVGIGSSRTKGFLLTELFCGR